jgi:hypothetical protein
MKKITELTKKQTAKMSEYREEWIAKGLCTNQDSTNEDFTECFHAVETLTEEKLKGFIVCDSPLDMISKGADKGKLFSESSYGQWEATWISYYKFFRDECGLELDERMNDFITMAEHTCWVYIQQDTRTVYFCRKPIEVHMLNGLLNNGDGPSVLFKDGFSVWSLEGHRVTEQIVMNPKTLTVEQIHKEENSDIQTIMVDRFGWQEYIEQCESKLLDSRRNDIENTVEVLYQTKNFGLRLFCTCPTGRVFVKGVPPGENINSCEDAQNWLSGYQRDNRKKFQTIGRT